MAGIGKFIDSHIFDPTKKITKVDHIIHRHEDRIMQMNFYHNEERLVAVGETEEVVDRSGRVVFGRREVFEIADDEQLIGCELSYSRDSCFRGVTWLKWKISE